MHCADLFTLSHSRELIPIRLQIDWLSLCGFPTKFYDGEQYDTVDTLVCSWVENHSFAKGQILSSDDKKKIKIVFKKYIVGLNQLSASTNFLRANAVAWTKSVHQLPGLPHNHLLFQSNIFLCGKLICKDINKSFILKHFSGIGKEDIRFNIE